MIQPDLLDHLVASVQSGSKYRQIDPDLIRWLGSQELTNHPSLASAVKATRNKLHQVAAVYQPHGINYPYWTTELDKITKDPGDTVFKDFCLRIMQQHTSTRERLPIIETFYPQVLTSIAPVHSILDLACGLNPLAIPWMPLADDSYYYACDIYIDLVNFLNHFFSHVRHNGFASTIDLIHAIPTQRVELAILLKTIPCLEQLDKTISSRLLDAINATFLLISFPSHSLGGHTKGMQHNYEVHFQELIAGRNWTYQRFSFPSELVFLVHTNP